MRWWSLCIVYSANAEGTQKKKTKKTHIKKKARSKRRKEKERWKVILTKGGKHEARGKEAHETKLMRYREGPERKRRQKQRREGKSESHTSKATALDAPLSPQLSLLLLCFLAWLWSTQTRWVKREHLVVLLSFLACGHGCPVTLPSAVASPKKNEKKENECKAIFANSLFFLVYFAPSQMSNQKSEH